MDSFMKINRETVTSQVYSDLLDKILNNEFEPGSTLPSEMKLSELYGVSRSTIRSAIQKLESLGLVDVRVGYGTVVLEQNFLNLMSSVSEVVASEDMFPYLFEFRAYIENACIELTIDRANEEDIKKLENLAKKLYEAALERDAEKFILEDYKFHYELTVTSKNKIFELVYSIIKDIFYKSITININEMLKNNIDYLLLSAERHIKLVELIRNKNLEDSLELSTFIIDKFDKDRSYKGDIKKS